MQSHFLAVSISLVIYVCLTMAYYGWGRLSIRIFNHQHLSNNTHQADYVWLGWAITLLLFQLLHFLVPLNAYVVIPVLTVGMIVTLIKLLKLVKGRFPLSTRAQWLGVAAWSGVLLLIATWISSRSMLLPTNIDTGIYHLATMKWYSTYRLLPGLGNLSSRFAFNQSFFTYATILDFAPYFSEGRTIANSFLFLMVCVTSAEQIIKSIRDIRNNASPHPYTYIPGLLSLPVLLYLALSANGLASPTPDLASTLLQIVMFTIFSRIIAQWHQSEQDNLGFLTLGLLASTSITVKLSNAAFALSIILLLLIQLWRHKNPLAWSIFIISAIIAVTWIGHSYVLSGVPVFPSTLGYVEFDWAMPKERVIQEAEYIVGWSKDRTNTFAEDRQWNWVKPWFDRVKTEYVAFVYPVFSAVVLLIATVVLHLRKHRNRLSFTDSLLALPIVAGLVYWFLVAPNIRFAHAVLFLLPILVSMILAKLIIGESKLNRKQILPVLGVIFVLMNLHIWAYAFNHLEEFGQVSTSGWYRIPSPPMKMQTTDSGLIVYTPAGTQRGQQCLDGPLMCIPRLQYNSNLALRQSEDLNTGFKIQK